jgi:hypothetical protein
MRYILLLTVFASCSSLYIPNTRNVPLFREQGEAQISTYLCSGGLDFQAAYALTDHLAAIGSYAYGSAKRTNPDYTFKNSYGEIGLGYYDRSRSVRYEILGGYGMGQGTSYDQYYFFGLNSVVSTGKMQKIFLQPSIGTNNRDFNVAFTPRFALVNYSEFTDAVKTVKPNEKAQFFIEPALTIKFRMTGNIHGFCQLGITTPVPSEVFFDYMRSQFAVGFQIDTGGLRTKVY